MKRKPPKLSNTRTVVNKNTSLHIYIECDENKNQTKYKKQDS